MMDDDSLMPFGKFKGERMEDIPAWYLLWLLKQDWITDWPDVHEYILDVKEILERE